MKEPIYQLRDWTPEDHPMITEWRRLRLATDFPAHLVPPNAVIVEKDGEPVAFAALLITIPREGGSSLGWCEAFTTAPGLTLGESRMAAGHVMDFFRAVGRDSGVSALFAYCSGGVKRVLTGLGMQSYGFGLDVLIEPLT